MSSPAHFAHAAAEGVKNLEPLPEKKNAFVAFLVGFLFGGIGLAIYLKSIKEGLMFFMIALAAGILLPGIGLLLVHFGVGCLAAIRVNESNQKRSELLKA